VISLVQSFVLKQEAVKKALGIPEVPVQVPSSTSSPPLSPFAKLYEENKAFLAKKKQMEEQQRQRELEKEKASKR